MSSSDSAASRLNIRGVLVALSTPFDEHQRISFDKLKHNLELYEKIPLTGYVTPGTFSEAPFLTPEERIQIVKFVRENTDKSKMVIGGTTAESTKVCCEMTREMAKVGADGVFVMPPFYYKAKMTDEALIAHYTTVADEGGLPIVIYNNPWVTGMDLSIPLLTKLAQHPLIRGVKDSDVRKGAALVQETRSYNFDVVTAAASFLLPALVNGCVGSITGLAGILGQEMCDLYDAFCRGDFKKAMEIQARLILPDVRILAQPLGAAGLKAAMDMMGYYGGHCRRPILPLPEDDKQMIKETLEKAGYLSANKRK